MSRVLVVDDDPHQAEIRRLLIEHAGHTVLEAHDAASARVLFAEWGPEIVLVDLRLRGDGDGLELVREFRAMRPTVRILVLSGWTADLTGRAEASMVDAVLAKPSGAGTLLKTIARLAGMALIGLPLFPQSFPFEVKAAGETVAELTLSAPGGSWAKFGAEAAVADIRVDDRAPFQVMVFNGPEPHKYPVFLGALAAGPHTLKIERNRQHSAAAVGLAVGGVSFKTASSAALEHAPVLLARQNTIGKFSDVPLLVYAEELLEGGDPILQYTVIFSNEDGGTSTRALMARWGRTTDIEYVYRVNRRTGSAIIQSRDHKDIPYTGGLEGKHPLLLPVTDNNMVEPAPAGSVVRYQIAPIVVDLTTHAREQVMDDHAWTYRVASGEMRREGKLRPFGTVDAEKISEPRNYLYVELKVANRSSGVGVSVRLRDDPLWRNGDLGRADYAISRDGWVRTTVELPPGTRPGQIAEIGLSCVVAPGPERRLHHSGTCRVEAVSKVFMLDGQDRPGASVWQMAEGVELPTGVMRAFSIR
jgi:CheY-like chemotaxis protein